MTIKTNIRALEVGRKVNVYCWSCNQKETLVISERSVKHVNALSCACGGYFVLPNGKIKIKGRRNQND